MSTDDKFMSESTCWKKLDELVEEGPLVRGEIDDLKAQGGGTKPIAYKLPFIGDAA